MEWKTIISAVVGSVITTIVIGSANLFGNWAFSGALVHTLGGMTQTDVIKYLKEHLKEYLLASGEQTEGMKIEVKLGDPSGSAEKISDGTYLASASERLCPEGYSMIGGVCRYLNEAPTTANIPNIQSAGINENGVFQCDWAHVTKPDMFVGWVKPVCARIKKE
jgi:hypothetical protein